MIQSFFENKEPNSILMHRNSQLLLNNQFQFIHPYDMEPCKEIIRFESGIDWENVPFEDEEWNYMLNRQEYLLDLCVSFDITGDKKYLEKGKYFIFDWIEKNGTTTNWRTIDTGIRLTYWQIMLSYLDKSSLLSMDENKLVNQSIQTQLNYLDSHYIVKYDLSNWGILITTGFFLITQRLDVADDFARHQRMLERLKNQVRLQIQPSGNHWEQSPLYFMEVLRSLVCIHQCGIFKEQLFQKELEQAITSMYYFMPHFVTPEGTTILQGDTDEMTINDVMQTMAILYDLKLPVLFDQKVSVDYLLLYMSNKKLNHTFWQDKISKQIAPHFITSLNDDYTGNYYYRSSWNQTASYCHLYNGSLGSGHGHLSLGHIDLALCGDNIFVDSGRLTYVESSIRQVLKEVSQHNTVVVNNQPFGKATDSWGYTDVPTSLSNRVYENKDYWAVRSMYLDNDILGTFKIVRTVLYLKKLKSFLVMDQVIGMNSSPIESMTRYFHLNPKIEAKQEGNYVNLLFNGNLFWAHFTESTINLDESFYAPRYNELVVNEKIVATSHKSAQSLLITQHEGIYMEEVELHKTDGKTFTEDQCYGVKIVLGDKEWLIYSMIEDTYAGHKLYTIENYPVYGQFGVVTCQSKEAMSTCRIF